MTEATPRNDRNAVPGRIGTHRMEHGLRGRSLAGRVPTRRGLAAALLLLLAQAPAAWAGIHTWDVVEVFSNADGTIQYVELLDRGTTGGETGIGNGSLSSGTRSISWSNGPVAPPTNGKSYLVATAAFAALPGAPTPDVIIPPASVPFFDVNGDTISFGAFDTLTFGAVPTNGVDALFEATNNGGTTIVANTPRNYAGVQGSVDASPPPVPSGSAGMIALILALLAGTGLVVLRSGRKGRVTG